MWNLLLSAREVCLDWENRASSSWLPMDCDGRYVKRGRRRAGRDGRWLTFFVIVTCVACVVNRVFDAAVWLVLLLIGALLWLVFAGKGMLSEGHWDTAEFCCGVEQPGLRIQCSGRNMACHSPLWKGKHCLLSFSVNLGIQSYIFFR